jgi:hypothetical protein
LASTTQRTLNGDRAKQVRAAVGNDYAAELDGYSGGNVGNSAVNDVKEFLSSMTARAMATIKLFMVLLGGTHARARTEVHDIAFAVGHDLDDIEPQLVAQWFGERTGLHIDAWMEIDGVDGFKVVVGDEPPTSPQARLYFLHLGGYDPARFGEEHGFELVVATSVAEAKRIGKTRRPHGWAKPHTDALHEVDACLEIARVGDAYITLIAGAHAALEFANTYKVIA